MVPHSSSTSDDIGVLSLPVTLHAAPSSTDASGAAAAAAATSTGDEDKISIDPAVDVGPTLLDQAGAKAGTDKDKTSKLELGDLGKLSREQQHAVLSQIALPSDRRKAGLRDLFVRFATPLDLSLNALGLFFAIVAGVAQPAMTIIFGDLTTSFTAFSATAAAFTRGEADQSALDRASETLFDDVLLGVYVLIALGFGSMLATCIYQGTFIYTGEATVRRLRQAYLHSVLRQNVAFFDAVGTGELTTRIQSDSHLVQQGISAKVAETVYFVAIFIAGIVIAFTRNAKLAGVIFTIVPAIAIAGGLLESLTARYKERSLAATAANGSLAQEVIAGVRTAVALQAERALVALYGVKNAQAARWGRAMALVGALGMMIIFFMIYGSYGLAFYYGGTLILQDSATPGDVVGCFFAIVIGAFSLAQAAPNMQAIAVAMAAADKLLATIDRVPVIDSSSTDGFKPEAATRGEITFDNVDFFYPARPAVQVLHRFSATFAPGTNTALVGASGSGKSTIANLCLRFYDAAGGQATLDRVPLKDWNVRHLRSQIGLVSQEPTLFACSVADNIAHGLRGALSDDPKARHARVVDAATRANAHTFIEKLPDGYDTVIGEGGRLLSGGQKQRIAIARAIVGDPPVLILDEATSALDTASERVVQDALDRAAAGRCTITIAHRLSTIKNADQIIVMSAGRVIERAQSGDGMSAHRRLLQDCDGPYSRLVAAQRFRDSDDTGEMGEDEKPAFATLTKHATGRSVASRALSDSRHDLERAAGKRKANTFTLLLRILWINRADWPWYTVGLVSAAALGCVYPVFGIVFGRFIGVFESQDAGELRAGTEEVAFWSLIIAIIAGIACAIANWSFVATAESIASQLRMSVLSAILRQDMAYFDDPKVSTGSLTANVADHAQKINSFLGMTFSATLQLLFTIVAGAIVGLVYAWQIALVAIATIPLNVAAGVLQMRIVFLKDDHVKESHAESAQLACEAATAIRTVAALTREDECYDAYCRELDGPQRASNRVAIIAACLFGICQALLFWVLALVFWWGVKQVAEGTVTAEAFFVALMSVTFATIDSSQIFMYVPDLSHFSGAARDVFKLLDSEPEIDANANDGEPLDDCKGHVRLENVHFRYASRPHVPVLRGLDIEVKPGQYIALVGESGCGKSSTLALLERFYDPQHGAVMIDGKDIRDLNVKSYRKHLAFVGQEPTLYAGTIRFNIALGGDDISDDEIHTACRKANIHDYVMTLPDQYDTEVGQRGTALSGGQKQRLCIARALVRHPKVLLLDEATSALDSESQRAVQQALDEAAKGRSTIAIAHRLSAIQGADIIYVIKDGRVFERGNHNELMSRRGHYCELVTAQELEKAQ